MRFSGRHRLVWLFLCWLIPGSAFGSDYGTTGIIDVPSARFENDGAFVASASTDGRHKQYAITYQATPWLQGTFRYTGFDDFFFWDRNYELKALLKAETTRLPQVAVGVRDIVGTSYFGSEYVVASKRFGATDITAGVGWGRLSGKSNLRNPLRLLDVRFGTRDAVSGPGGDLTLGQFFSGRNVGLFGGITHDFSALGISAALEFNPDQYDKDFLNGVSRPKSPFTMGLTWKALPGLDLKFSYQHGEVLGLGFRSYLNSREEVPRRPDDRFISSYFLPQKDLPPQINKNNWYQRLLYDVERSGLLLIEGSVSADGSVAELVVGNLSYSLWSDAIGRLLALADLHLPARVNELYFVIEEAGHRVITVVMDRPSTAIQRNHLSVNRALLASRSREMPQNRTGFFTGKVNSTINLRSRFQLFDPDDPARYQVYADLASEFHIDSNWSIHSSIAIDIDNNFSESRRRESNSALPKVRSDVVKYLIGGATGLEKLLIEGRGTLGRRAHFRLVGGYLETMYAGVGGELLYWPARSRVAVGMSAALVRQRNFDREFGLRDYSVLSGHISGYWATPYYDYDLALHVGRYLAKDWGGTFEIRRTFRNGWQVGLWATLTDVPFDVFGEGSFDKGLYFQVPLDNVFGSRSRSKFKTRLRPIQRDGGQRLEGFSGDIFWDVREARYDAFKRDERLLP